MFAMTASDSLRSRKSGPPVWRLVLLLGLLDTFGPLGIDMYLPAFPQIEQQLQAPPGAMPQTLSVFLLGLAIGQLICGPVSDWLGRRVPLLYGSAAFALASAGCVLAGSIESLILARFIMGLAGATGMVIARAVVRDMFDETESAQVYSLLMLVIGIAPIVSPSVGSWLMTFGDWTLIFWSMALFGLVCGVAVLFDLPETLPVERRVVPSLPKVFRQYGKMLVDFRYLGYTLPAGLALGEIFAYVATAPNLFMKMFGLSPTLFTIAFAGNAMGLIGMAQVNRRLTRRMSSHAILTCAALANAVVTLLLALLAWTHFGGMPLFLVALFFSLGTLGLILPNAGAAAMAPYPDHAGAASALLGTLQFVVGSVTGALVGFLDDGTPRPMALIICGCGLLCATIVQLAERRRRQQAAGFEPAPALAVDCDV
jgi:DHA1 family bicyclomycin/chloramphenicol resistance-like MFS transporter